METNGSSNGPPPKESPLDALKSLPQLASLQAGSAAASESPEAAALNSLLKNSPLMNPALLSLNPQLYLAQLQAAQLLSAQGGLMAAANARRGSEEASEDSTASSRKRKMDESGLNLSAKRSPSSSPKPSEPAPLRTGESPLDLSGAKGPFGSVDLMGQLAGSPFGAAAAKMPKMDPETLAKFPGLGPWAAAAGAGASALHNPLLAAMNPLLAGAAGLPGLGAGALGPFAGLAAAGLPATSEASMFAAAAAAAAAAAGNPVPGLTPPTTTTTSAGKFDPLERMSQIAKGGQAGAGAANSAGNRTSPSSPGGLRAGGGAGMGPRHSAWQSQWISRGPESSKDIFKCVWCKESYSSLQSLTAHMKETKHFGSAMPASGKHLDINTISASIVFELRFSTGVTSSFHFIKHISPMFQAFQAVSPPQQLILGPKACPPPHPLCPP